MVRYLELENGEKLPLKAGFMCLRDFEQETGKSLLNLEDELTMKEVEALFYYAYVNGCLATKDIGYLVKYTREDAALLMEELFLDFYALILLLVEDFMATHKKKLEAMSKQAKKPAKKKTS